MRGYKQPFDENPKKRTIIYLILSSCYKVAIDILFSFGSSVIYYYLGRILAFDSFKYVLGWVAYLLFLFYIEKINHERIRYMVKCIFLLAGTSNFSIFGLRGYDYEYFFYVLIFWILLIFWCNVIAKLKILRRRHKLHGFKGAISYKHKDDLLLMVGFLITLYAVAKFGLNVSDYTMIYSARETFRSQNISLVDSYLLSWNGTVILPLCFLLYLNKKKYMIAVLPLILGTIMFMINGLKTWLMIYLIVAGFSFLYRKKVSYDYIINVLLIGGTFLSFFSLLLMVFAKQYQLVGLVDRVIILPGEINYYYLAFFHENEFLYLRESILKYFFQSPYSPWSPVQISQSYMSSAYYHNATNGLIGDYYGNFGMVGLLVYPVLVSYLFLKLEEMLDGYAEIISAVVCFVLMWVLVNTSFFTWLMTGGYIFYMLLLYIYKKCKVKV